MAALAKDALEAQPARGRRGRARRAGGEARAVPRGSTRRVPGCRAVRGRGCAGRGVPQRDAPVACGRSPPSSPPTRRGLQEPAATCSIGRSDRGRGPGRRADRGTETGARLQAEAGGCMARAQGRPQGEIRGAVRGHGRRPAGGQRLLARFGPAQPGGARDAGGRAHAGRRDGRGVGLPRNQPGAVRAQRRRHVQRVLRRRGQGGRPGSPPTTAAAWSSTTPTSRRASPPTRPTDCELEALYALRDDPGLGSVLRPRGNRGRAGVPLRRAAVDGGVVPGMPWRA